MPKTDLLLINPGNRTQMYGKLGGSISAIEPPIWAALIAAFIRKKGFSVKIIDADAESLSPEAVADMVIKENPILTGVGAFGANPSASSTPKMEVVNDIISSLKRISPNSKIFTYGIHPSALPQRTLEEGCADFVCKGECFNTIYELLKILTKNINTKDFPIDGLCYKRDSVIVNNGWGKLIENLDELPLAAWDLLPMDLYRAHNWHCFAQLEDRAPYAVIYTSLGCPFNCTYCNVRSLYNGKPGIRFRSIKSVVDEIGVLVNDYRVRNIKILDELFVIKQERVIELCDLIIKQGYDLNIWAYARIDTINKAILGKMKRAGINWLAFGIESGSMDVRNDAGKRGFDRAGIMDAIKMTHEAGIHAVGNFIFGLPNDNIGTMKETLKLAKALNCEYANFYVAMAYPGSDLYQDSLRKGTKLPDSWLGFAQFSAETLPLPNKNLSSEEILCFRDKAFKEYYSSPAYLKMLEDKFGHKAVEHIKDTLSHKIYRKILAPF